MGGSGLLKGCSVGKVTNLFPNQSIVVGPPGKRSGLAGRSVHIPTAFDPDRYQGARCDSVIQTGEPFTRLPHIPESGFSPLRDLVYLTYGPLLISGIHSGVLESYPFNEAASPVDKGVPPRRGAGDYNNERPEYVIPPYQK